MFPLLSVAVQVTTFVPSANCAGALLVTVTAPQLSLAVGLASTTPVAKQTPTSAFTVTSVGHTMVGGWLSRTVTVKVQVLVLPLLSVAVLVTVVTPTGKAEPLAFAFQPAQLIQPSVEIFKGVADPLLVASCPRPR